MELSFLGTKVPVSRRIWNGRLHKSFSSARFRVFL